MKLRLSAAAALVATLALTGSAAFAQQDIVIPINSVAFGNPGDLVLVSEQQVDPSIVGGTCVGTLTTENNESVHEGNDLIVSTDDRQLVVPNVEAADGQTTQVSGEYVIGSNLKVELRLGPDGVTSGGLTLTLSCQPPAALPDAQPEQPVEALPDFTG